MRISCESKVRKTVRYVSCFTNFIDSKYQIEMNQILVSMYRDGLVTIDQLHSLAHKGEIRDKALIFKNIMQGYEPLVLFLLDNIYDYLRSNEDETFLISLILEGDENIKYLIYEHYEIGKSLDFDGDHEKNYYYTLKNFLENPFDDFFNKNRFTRKSRDFYQEQMVRNNPGLWLC
jgi:hypothetical protein